MMDDKMIDQELDRLLAATKQPPLPAGFAAKLQDRLNEGNEGNVVAFPQRKAIAAPKPRVWLSAIPLAASLAFGIYIGATGTLPESLEGTLVSEVGDTLLGTGVEDTESFLNGDLS